MIVATTKMQKIPENCKKCSLSSVQYPDYYHSERVCTPTKRVCPTEKKPSGNVGYGMPSWCPLIDIELIAENEDETDTKINRR